MKKYSDFFGNAGNLYSTYNGDLIYDITNGLVNNIWTPVIQPFFGGQLQFDTINKLF